MNWEVMRQEFFVWMITLNVMERLVQTMKVIRCFERNYTFFIYRHFQYEYDKELEDSFRSSLFKSFKKQIDDGYFTFVIVDGINNKTKHYEDMWSYGKQRGFEVQLLRFLSHSVS